MDVILLSLINSYLIELDVKIFHESFYIFYHEFSSFFHDYLTVINRISKINHLQKTAKKKFWCDDFNHLVTEFKNELKNTENFWLNLSECFDFQDYFLSISKSS